MTGGDCCCCPRRSDYFGRIA